MTISESSVVYKPLEAKRLQGRDSSFNDWEESGVIDDLPGENPLEDILTDDIVFFDPDFDQDQEEGDEMKRKTSTGDKPERVSPEELRKLTLTQFYPYDVAMPRSGLGKSIFDHWYAAGKFSVRKEGDEIYFLKAEIDAMGDAVDKTAGEAKDKADKAAAEAKVVADKAAEAEAQAKKDAEDKAAVEKAAADLAVQRSHEEELAADAKEKEAEADAQAKADAEVVRRMIEETLDPSIGAIPPIDDDPATETPPVPIGRMPICAVATQLRISEDRVRELAGIGHLPTVMIDGVLCFKPEDLPKLQELNKMHPEVAESSAPPVSEAPPKAPEKKESQVSQTETKSETTPPATPPKGNGEKGVHSVHSRTACQQSIELVDGKPVIKNHCICGNCRPVQQVLLMPSPLENKDDRLVVPPLPPHDPKGHGEQSHKNGLPWWVPSLFFPLMLIALATLCGIVLGRALIDLSVDSVKRETSKAIPSVTKVTDTAAVEEVKTDLVSVKQQQDEKWREQAEKNSELTTADSLLNTATTRLRGDMDKLKGKAETPTVPAAPVVIADPAPPAVTPPAPLTTEEQAALVKFTRQMKFVTDWAKQAKKGEPSILVDDGIGAISGFGADYQTLRRMGARRILEEIPPGQVSMDLVELALKKNGIK